ncbi:ABC transporter ATP-binding protein [Nakamurella silvestris]|nr:ABC transporter ATP-binding protein [Nakamurella silvestris]
MTARTTHPLAAETPHPANVLELRDVSRSHGGGLTAVQALAGVSLSVRAGEFVAVMGPSGSGKSTLLHLAGGLDTPTGGEILVEGHTIGALSRTARAQLRRRSIGYIFQDFNLLPTLTAAENVSLPGELGGVRRSRAHREALAALDSVGLTDQADRFPDQLSGGQQQRVAIARALVGDRRLVLADEPTGALDSATGEGILQILRERADLGAAVVMVSHEARHAAWADRVIFLRDGSIVDATVGAPAETLLGRREDRSHR